MKNIFLFLFIVFIISSCEKTVNNVDLPDIDPQLVAQSFLTENQDSVKVYLSWSAPIYSTYEYDFEDVKDADVYISNNGNKIKLSYVSASNPYKGDDSYYIASAAQLDMNIGEKMELEISEPKGNHISSETFIPSKPNYTLNLISTDSIKDDWSEFGYTFKYSFDLQGNNDDNINYYTTNAMGYYYDTYVGIDSTFLRDYSTGTSYYKIPKGNTIKMVFNSYRPLDSIKVSVLHTDEAYYKYHNSVALFDGGDNPFSEPVIIYSNIKNGLGVFCSYNTSHQTFIIK